MSSPHGSGQFPVQAKPSPEVAAQTSALIDHIMNNYDIARARRMVERLGLDGDGPFLVALLQPLGAPAEIDRDRLLVYDLSGVPPVLIYLWIEEFKRQTARAEYWQHDLRHLALLLRTSITTMAEAFSATQEAQGAIVIEPFRSSGSP